MKKYKRNEIEARLRQKGIRVDKAHIVIPADLAVGIKLWGMIDFLNLPWQREEKKKKRRRR